MANNSDRPLRQNPTKTAKKWQVLAKSEFEEKQRHPRIDTLNLPKYGLGDVAGKKIDHGEKVEP
jgi:hypothetical protein